MRPLAYGKRRWQSKPLKAKKAEASPDNPILKYLGSALFAAVVAFLAWFAAGSVELRAALTTLAGVVGGVCALVTSLLYTRHLGVLGAGAAPARSPERTAYVRLRNGLAEGGKPALIYARWLTKFLDAVDRFFGDAGLGRRALFPHIFGLKTPVPLWTPAAFDRCLLLAILYPMAAVYITWAVSGHVGPAETLFSLKPGLLGWQRSFAVVLLAIGALAAWRFGRTPRLKNLIWLVIGVGCQSAGALVGSGAFPSIVSLVGTLAGALVVCLAGDYAGVIACAGAFSAIGATALFVAVAPPGITALNVGLSHSIASHSIALTLGATLTVVGACAGAFGAAMLNTISAKHRWHGAFLLLFSILMISAYLAAADRFARLGQWGVHLSSLTLFMGLLTFLNAPFDWASLGLTRALLRRGLELGGWWPFLLAFVDALLAVAIIALLSLTMVFGVQAFNDLTLHGRGNPVLPLEPFFDGISAHPTAPEYWWVYATLFSTMIPSIVNLMIGGASLMRGVPGVPSLLLRFMPANKAVPAFERTWIATVLTLQLVGGAILGIVVQFTLVYAVFWHVMPWMGLELLDMARALAAWDLPGKLIAWL
jgi:hypothetical protein